MVFSPLVREYRFTGDGEVYLPVQDEPIASPRRLQACVGVVIADESQSGRRLPHSKSWRVCEARSTLAKRLGQRINFSGACGNWSFQLSENQAAAGRLQST